MTNMDQLCLTLIERGNCLIPGVIYKAEVTATKEKPALALSITTKGTYTGLSKY